MKSKLLPALFVGLFTFLQSISPVAWSGGNQWTSVEGLEGGSISALAIDPSNPTILYAGTNAGVFKSTNGGGSWSPANTGLTLKDTSIARLLNDNFALKMILADCLGRVLTQAFPDTNL